MFLFAVLIVFCEETAIDELNGEKVVKPSMRLTRDCILRKLPETKTTEDPEDIEIPFEFYNEDSDLSLME